jgi:hypothetical protein
MEMFEAKPGENGDWRVWEHGVQRWVWTPAGISEEGARAIASYLNQNQHKSQAPHPTVERALVKIGSDWLSCEIHERLRSPGGTVECRVVVWVDDDQIRPANNPPVRVRR